MNAVEKIRESLKEIMPVGEANACQIYKGWSSSTDITGWHYIPFGRKAIYLGDNLAEALEVLSDMAAEMAADR